MTTTTTNNKPQGIDLLWFYVGMIAILLGLAQIFGCNPTKRAYKGIEKHEPKSVKDSSRLANRAKATFPTPPPIVKPGQTQIRTVVREDTRKVKGLQSRVDSLLQKLQNNGCENVNLDSLRQAISQEIKDSCKPKEETIYKDRVDTLEIPSTAQEAKIFLLETKLAASQKAQQKSEYKQKHLEERWNDLSSVFGRFLVLLMTKWWFWLVVIGGVVFVLKRLKLIKLF